MDSDKTPILATQANPNGLRYNQVAWLNNATVRGGGISPRPGWVRLLVMPVAASARWGEAIMYETSGLPYIVCMIEGRVYAVRVDTDNSVTDVSALTGLTMPWHELPFMAQGEEFVVIQAGDLSTLPLFFWDDNISMHMRRSLGPNPAPYGVVAVATVAPAVGSSVLVDLTAPFTGQSGQLVTINGDTYQAFTGQVETITVKNLTAPGSAGTVIPAGSEIFTQAPSTAPDSIYVTLTDFTIPAHLGTVVVNIVRPYTGAVPTFQVGITNNFPAYGITAAGAMALGPNQILLVNIDATPGAAIAIGDSIAALPEIPAAGPMDYYMGRLWFGSGREYAAGDIVGGPSGTAAFGYRDSILRIFENTFLSLGGSFIVPDTGGNIRAIKHAVSLDTARGEGKLFVFTLPRIYSVNVVPTRAEWKTLTEPIQRVAQINFGTSGDRGVVGVNGDLFVQSPDGIRAVIEAIRYFEQWGNLPVSIEENRAIANNNRALLKFGSGILFDNRILQTCLPQQTDVGVVHGGIMPLNFDVISTLQQKQPPGWEGVWEGVNVLRLLKGNFGGRERAFAFIAPASGGPIELWELSESAQQDSNATGDARVSWVIDFPSYNAGQPFELKELETVELWIDRLSGTVDFRMEFRPDQHPCWEYYHAWQECAPRNNCEDVYNVFPNPSCYPQQSYRPAYIATAILPKPPATCEVSQGRPINIGYGFQFRLFITGYCRIRGIRVHMLPRDKQPFEKIVCGDRQPANEQPVMKTIEDTRTRAVS